MLSITCEEQETLEVEYSILEGPLSLFIFQCLNFVFVVAALRCTEAVLSRSLSIQSHRKYKRREAKLLWAIVTGCQSMGKEWFERWRRDNQQRCLVASFRGGAFYHPVFADSMKGATKGKDEHSLGPLRLPLQHRLTFTFITEDHLNASLDRALDNGVPSWIRLTCQGSSQNSGKHYTY